MNASLFPMLRAFVKLYFASCIGFQRRIIDDHFAIRCHEPEAVA